MKLLIFLLLISLTGYSQQKSKGYFSAAIGAYFPKGIDPPVGLHVSGNKQIGTMLFIGMQVGIVKFKGMPTVYVPLQAKFSLVPGINSGKVSMIITIEPGYGFYNDLKIINTEGGFTFYGGAGVVFPSKVKGRVFMTLGYSLFGFETAGIKYKTEALGVRMGIMLR